jgi:hypothetical protein
MSTSSPNFNRKTRRFEQRFKHGSGLRSILREDIALADIVGTFAARERRLVKGYVADKIEGVEGPCPTSSASGSRDSPSFSSSSMEALEIGRAQAGHQTLGAHGGESRDRRR